MWRNLFIEDERESVTLYDSEPNGNCFFESISEAIKSSHTQNVSCEYLRKLIARSILTPSKKTDKIILTWRELYDFGLKEKDQSILTQFRHIKPVSDIPLTQKLTADDKIKIAKCVMNKSYWADEYAMRIIQEVLNIGICVINTEKKKFFPPLTIEGDEWNPKNVSILLYSGNHYDLVKYKDKGIISIKTLLKIMI